MNFVAEIGSEAVGLEEEVPDEAENSHCAGRTPWAGTG